LRTHSTYCTDPMAFAWTLVLSSVGSLLIITALFLTVNGIYRGDNVGIILLNILGGALLTAAATGNAFGEDGTEFIPFVILNGIFALIAASGLARWLRKKICGVGASQQSTAIDIQLESTL